MENTKPDIIIPDLINQLNKKYEIIIFVIIGTFIVALAAMIFMAVTLLIDARHFSSVTYTEYSQKTESVEVAQKINQELLDQNQKNQQLILDQQKIIQQLLKK